MGLVFTGAQASSDAFELLLEAYDGDTRVMVATSQEAVEDHGLDAVEQCASRKYAAGVVDSSGRVRVTTGDFG